MLVLVSCALALWFVYYRVKNRRFLQLAADVPDAMTPLPLVGNLHQIYGDGEHAFKLLRVITEATEKFNSAVKMWFGPYVVYCLSKPEDIKLVTNVYAGKPFMYDLAKSWVAEGLVTASVPVWKRHVKKVAPTFAPTVVDGFLGVFNAQANALVDRLRTEVGKGPFVPFRKYLTPTTLEIVCQTAFGVTDMSERVVSSEYMEAFNDVLELTMKRGLNPLMYSDFLYSLTPSCRRYNRCLKILHGVSTAVIKKKREAVMMKTASSEQSGYKNFKAFLDLLMELPENEAFSDEELRAEIDTLIVGGQETTASTLNFLLLNVGTYPHVQEKLYAELKEIFGDSSRAVGREDLRRMVYADAVVKETLRMFPPTPGVMRLADRELQLDGYRIPRGSLCVICVWGAGRWRRAWGADAELFRPERWLAPGFVPDAAAYVPFSYGKRVCIGRLYAMMVLKTALAQILRAYTIKSDVSKIRFKIDLVLRPVEGDDMQIELRH